MKTLLALGLVLLLLIFPLVSAVGLEDFKSAVGDFGNLIANGAGEFVGPLFAEKEVATKSLFAILLFMVLYTSVDAVFRKKWPFTALVTGIVTILATWWMPAGFISAIRSNYGALGATILFIIPFMIMVAFTLRVESDLVGRALWIFYAIYYLAVYLYSIATSATGWISLENIPYYAAIVGGLVMFIFMPAVRNAIFKGKLNEIKAEGARAALEAKVLREIKEQELKSYQEK